MGIDEEIDRSEAIRRLKMIFTGTLATGAIASSRILGYSAEERYTNDDQNTDPTPITQNSGEEQHTPQHQPVENQPDPLKDLYFHEAENSFLGNRIKLLGVFHTRESAIKLYSKLEEYIAHASVAVLEASPPQINGPGVFHDAQAYFKTVHDLCEKYDKPIITLDPLSFEAIQLEQRLSLAAGTYAACQSWKMFSRKTVEQRKSRRTALKMGLGTYLFMGAFIGGDYLRSAIQIDSSLNASLRNEAFYLNHLIDQRNVEITNKIIRLPELAKEDLNKGDYIFANFGAAHTIGIDFYLRHPILRSTKSGLYSFNYDLVDSDTIAKYTPLGNGQWKEEVLEV